MKRARLVGEFISIAPKLNSPPNALGKNASLYHQHFSFRLGSCLAIGSDFLFWHLWPQASGSYLTLFSGETHTPPHPAYKCNVEAVLGFTGDWQCCLCSFSRFLLERMFEESSIGSSDSSLMSL